MHRQAVDVHGHPGQHRYHERNDDLPELAGGEAGAAPPLIHSSARTIAPSTMTVLASHGSSFCRSPSELGEEARLRWGAFLLLAGPPTASTWPGQPGRTRPRRSPRRSRPREPTATATASRNPTKCAIVPSDPAPRVSHAIAGGAARTARARPAARAATQVTTRARLAPRSRSWASATSTSAPGCGGGPPVPAWTTRMQESQETRPRSPTAPPAHGGDLRHQDMRLDPGPARPASAAASPSVRHRIHGGGSDNEGGYGAENQRQRADSTVARRRDVGGLSRRLSSSGVLGGRRAAALHRQVARHKRPGRGDAPAPGYAQDPFDLRKQSTSSRLWQRAEAVGRERVPNPSISSPVAARIPWGQLLCQPPVTRAANALSVPGCVITRTW